MIHEELLVWHTVDQGQDKEKERQEKVFFGEMLSCDQPPPICLKKKIIYLRGYMILILIAI